VTNHNEVTLRDFCAFNKFKITKISQHYSQSSIEIWKRSLGTEEKRGITFRSSTDEVFVTLFRIIKLDKKNKLLETTGGAEHSKGNKTVPTKMITARTEDGHK
jgi:hypothetical protein